MNEENEKVTIDITNGAGISTRTITDEWNATDTCWPHLVEVFLEQLQGLGYKFAATPEEMVDVLEDYHQELLCAECDDYKEEKPAVEEKKYPYIGILEVPEGVTIVEFTAPSIGTVKYTSIESADYKDLIGREYASWAEEKFKKVSK